MFVRVKSTPNSPRRSVQVVESSRVGDRVSQRIVRHIGVVRGLSVRSRNVVSNIGASFQILMGGNITAYTKLAETTRQEAFDLLVQHAEAAGANAIVAMRYDANEMAAAVTEVIAYGTAVVVEPIPA